MPKTVLDKLFLKQDFSVAILHLPGELNEEFQTVKKADVLYNVQYAFILGFYSKAEELKKEIESIKASITPTTLLWIAYPKNKALETDLNRDILHELMAQYNLDGVSLISLNDIWSAMRFKIK